MPHADSPTCSTGLIQTRRWQRRYSCPPLYSPSSLYASAGGPPTHTATSPLLLTCHQSRCPEKPPSGALLFPTFPLSFRPESPSGFEPLWRGVMFTPLLRGLCCRLGQASCCSSNSIVLNGDVGRIKLVIFQAWSVLGRYAIRECKAVKKRRVEKENRSSAVLCICSPAECSASVSIRSVGEHNLSPTVI